jgi:hypothetical protein
MSGERDEQGSRGGHRTGGLALGFSVCRADRLSGCHNVAISLAPEAHCDAEILRSGRPMTGGPAPSPRSFTSPRSRLSPGETPGFVGANGALVRRWPTAKRGILDEEPRPDQTALTAVYTIWSVDRQFVFLNSHSSVSLTVSAWRARSELSTECRTDIGRDGCPGRGQSWITHAEPEPCRLRDGQVSARRLVTSGRRGTTCGRRCASSRHTAPS